MTTFDRPAAVLAFMPTMTPRSLHALTTRRVTSAATGLLDTRSSTSSTPASRPSPRTSPTWGRASRGFSRCGSEFAAARAGRSSPSMMSMVRSATAQAAGWPPKVLMCRSRPGPVAAKRSWISRRTAVTAIGR